MLFAASWCVVGVVTERREIKSDKSKEWRGYVCKVASLGLTAEIGLTKEQYDAIGDGQHLRFEGIFEPYERALKLKCTKFVPASTGTVKP